MGRRADDVARTPGICHNLLMFRQPLHGFGWDEREVQHEHRQAEEPDGDGGHDHRVHQHTGG
jgi:hypothetical protein